MRIRDLRIENFRGLGRFEMKNLGRINLIVGENNSGKTTILEAVNILMAYGNAIPLWSVLSRRGEVVWDGAPASSRRMQDDCSSAMRSQSVRPSGSQRPAAKTRSR